MKIIRDCADKQGDWGFFDDGILNGMRERVSGDCVEKLVRLRGYEKIVKSLSMFGKDKNNIVKYLTKKNCI